jgi:hypothetical protein
VARAAGRQIRGGGEIDSVKTRLADGTGAEDEPTLTMIAARLVSQEVTSRLTGMRFVESIVDLTTPEDHLDSYQVELNVAAEKVRHPIRHSRIPFPTWVSSIRTDTTGSSRASAAK